MEASVIPGQGREQVDKLGVTELPRNCAVLIQSLILVLPRLVRVHRSNAGLVFQVG